MTSNRILISLLSGCILSLAGCSKEEGGHHINQGGIEKILLTSSIGTTRTLNQNIQASQLANGNTVGVYVTDEEAEVISDNTKITADGDGGFVYSRDLYWPVEGKANIYTYGPYQDSWNGKLNEDVEFTVERDQSTDNGYLKSDLVFGLPVAGNPLEQTSASVPLAFTHKLAKLNITVVNETETSLADATVILKDMPVTVTMNTKTGELGKTSGSDTIRVATFAGSASSYKCSAIVVPQKLTYGSQQVKVRLKNGKTMAATTRTDMELQSGKTYNFNITVTVGGADLNVTVSSITNWDNNTNDLNADIDTENAEEYVEPTDESSEATQLKATFGKPGGNASYAAPTYTWTAGNNNLMSLFEFANGELKNYTTLKFTISNLSDGASVRLGYYVGSTFTEIGKGYYSNGAKEVDLAELGVDLSTVTKISFGGRNASGSVDIKADEVILEGTASSGGSSSTDGNTLTATFGTPSSNATYVAPKYTWTGSSSNLMTCFEFANGELKDYKTLTFTFSNLENGPVRMGYYVGTTFTEFGNGFYSAGTKTVDLTTLGIDLSTVTKIAFGGRSNAGSCVIKASDVILSKE